MAAVVDPHEKMRGRDVNKVARGEQAPRPAREPLPPDPEEAGERGRQCYARYAEYRACVDEKGGGAPECDKLKLQYLSLCPSEWIERWDQQREAGTGPRR